MPSLQPDWSSLALCRLLWVLQLFFQLLQLEKLWAIFEQHYLAEFLAQLWSQLLE
jgi:hypothetical protein